MLLDVISKQLKNKYYLCFFLILFFCMIFSPTKANGEDISSYRIQLSGWISEIPPIRTQKTVLTGMTEITDYFSDGLGRNFTLIDIKMPTKDDVYFIKYESKNLYEKDYPIITIYLADTFSSSFYVVHPERVSKIPGAKVNLPIILRFENNSLYLRPIEKFSVLSHTMIDLDKNENVFPETAIGNGAFTFTLPIRTSPGKFCYNWFILSNTADLSKGDNNTSLATFDTYQRLFPDGCYEMTEKSYSPKTTNGYWRNPANIPGNWMVSNISDVSKMSSLATDISYVIASAAVFNQRKDGTWSTGPKSDWLFSNYKIGYDYYDDRRNTDGALFLARFNNLFEQPFVANAIEKYNNWLLSYGKLYGYKVQGGGILLPDYLAYNSKIACSHSALNHNLANINYCFETGKNNLLKISLGKQILFGINNTEKKWVKANHDLVYALSKGFKPIGSIDYIYLTRDDIVKTIDFCTKLKIDSFFVKKLLLEKELWLKNNGF